MPTLSVTVTGDDAKPAMQITLSVPVPSDAEALAVRLAGHAVDETTNPYPVPVSAANSAARTSSSPGAAARPS